MNETEPLAPHIRGLAYSQCEDDTIVVDYPNEPHDGMAPFVWGAAGAALVFTLTLVIMLASTFAERSQIASVPGSPPITVTQPAAAPSFPSLVSPPPTWQTPPRLNHVDPDEVFAASWNAEMPKYPFSVNKCSEYNKELGCWLHLDSSDPTDPQFTFLGRGRCDYIREHLRTGLYATVGAADELRIKFSDITVGQSREIVSLAVAAYCPQYK